MALTDYKPFDDWWADYGLSTERPGVASDYVPELQTSEPDEIQLLNFWRDYDFAAILVMIAEYV